MKRALSVTALCLGVFSWVLYTPALGDTEGMKDGHKMEAKAEVGEKAPDFTLKDVDGKEHKLSEYAGKVVVLEWTNHTCPFVVRHQKTNHTMQHTFAKFADKDVVWLAVDSTNKDFQGGYDIDGIKKWIASEDVQLPYPVLRDEDGAVGHLYGAKTTPHMFVIDKKGVLVYSGAIDDDPADDKDSDNNYVASAVTAALNGSPVETSSTKPYGCGIKYAK